MNKKFIVLMLFVLFSRNVFANNGNHKHPEPVFSAQHAERVLNLLDLSKPELVEVQQAHSKKEFLPACEYLLQYYRNRYQIKHLFLDRKNKIFEAAITETDKKWANDAMEHIFVGQRQYPSCFRGWDIDWNTNPIKDVEWIIQLHRLFWWDSMGKMYWQTKDEKYAKEWVYQLLDWTAKNPPDENNTNAWRHLEVGRRLIRLVDTFEYFIESPAFTVPVLVTHLENIYSHNEYLITRYPEKSNKTVTEAQSALTSAIYFPEFKDAFKWRQKAINILNSEIKTQVFPDGMQCELSLSYHRGTADGFLNSYQMAAENGCGSEFPSDYSLMLQKMAEASYKTLLPDFTTPQFGDGWKDTSQKTTSFFKRWNKVFNRDDFLYFATLGEKGKSPNAKNFALTNSGYYSMRSGWKQADTCMVIKCGPKAWSHAQPDNGSFELYALGRHFMPDSGCYIYHGDPEWRNWFRQTNVHQTLTLGNKDTECKPQLLVWQVSDDITTLVVKNQSYKNLSHRRAVFFINEKFFVIADRAEGSALGDVSIHFQFKEGKSVIDGNNLTARTDFEDGRNLLVKTKIQPEIRMQTEKGWVSYEYTKKIQRPAFCYTVKKYSAQNNVDFITVLLPYDGKLPNVSIDRFNSDENAIRFEITIDSKTYKVDCDLNKKETKYIL